MKYILNKNKGITLVAIVITIIVLIILAGVSINLIVGNNGIIPKTKEAKSNYQEASKEEEIKLNDLYVEMTEKIEDEEVKIADEKEIKYNENTKGGKLLPAYQIKQRINAKGQNFLNITAFLMSDEEPIASENVAEIQTADSTEKIYAWIDSNNKCYWYSEDKNPLANADMVALFKDCNQLETITGISTWDTSNVNNIKELCKNCNKLNSLEPFIGWNVTAVSGKNSEFLFQNCKAITSCEGLQNFRFTNITSLHCTFESCSLLSDISQLANWECDNLQELDSTFRGCSSLQSLTGIENWDVSNLNMMYRTFYQCQSLQDVDALSNWGSKLGKLTTLEECFYQDGKIQSLEGIKTWRTPSLTNMKSAFAQLKLIDNLKMFSDWDVSKVQNFTSTFDTFEKLETLEGLENWNVASATTFKNMFFNTRALKNATQIKKWQVASNMDFTTMFGGSHNYIYEIEQFENLSGHWESNGTYTVDQMNE